MYDKHDFLKPICAPEKCLYRPATTLPLESIFLYSISTFVLEKTNSSQGKKTLSFSRRVELMEENISTVEGKYMTMFDDRVKFAIL